MKLIATALAAAAAAGLFAAPAVAQLPTPPQSAATQQSQAYLFHAGAGDIYEVTSSMMAVQHSRNAEVRAFAAMLIDHHSRTSNAALATAAAAGVMPPPPELSPAQKAMIGQLIAGVPAGFDRVYMQQQVSAHQQALALQTGYAASGDVPALRQAAQGAVPVIQGHLTQAQQLLARVP